MLGGGGVWRTPRTTGFSMQTRSTRGTCAGILLLLPQVFHSIIPATHPISITCNTSYIYYLRRHTAATIGILSLNYRNSFTQLSL